MIDKKRNQMFDAVRGFCMLLIPVQHFISAAGLSEDGAGYYIYTCIDIFVMQTFFFLSGVFSKNPEKGHSGAVQGVLWPYLVACTLLYFGVWAGTGKIIDYPYIHPAPTMWFLLVLFYYRYFQKYYVKVPWLLGIAVVIYMGTGCINEVNTSLFALSRTLSFFVFFVIGYYFKLDYLKKLMLKWWQTMLLGIFLAAVSWYIVNMPKEIGLALKYKHSYEQLGFGIWEGMAVRLGILVISLLCIVFLMNIFRDRKSIWTHIGKNTMPVYIFHTLFGGVIFKVGLSGSYYVQILLAVGIAVVVTLLLTTRPAVRTYDILMNGTYGLVKRVIKRQ